MNAPQDLPGMLAEIEDRTREPDGHVIPYAYNWLTDPGAPEGSAAPQEDRVATMFAVSVLHLAQERDAALACAAEQLTSLSVERRCVERAEERFALYEAQQSARVLELLEQRDAALATVGTLKAKLLDRENTLHSKISKLIHARETDGHALRVAERLIADLRLEVHERDQEIERLSTASKTSEEERQAVLWARAYVSRCCVTTGPQRVREAVSTIDALDKLLARTT